MSAPKFSAQAFQSAMRKTRVNIFGAEKIRYGIEALDALAERVAVELCDTSGKRAVFMLNCGMDAHKAMQLTGAEPRKGFTAADIARGIAETSRFK